MHVLVSCKNKEVPIKNAVEWPQHFSHFKYMGIFQTLNGSLGQQSMVGSGRISNSSETLLLSMLPSKNEEDPIKTKMKLLET